MMVMLFEGRKVEGRVNGECVVKKRTKADEKV